MKYLYLVNDTSSTNHAGCKAVMRSLIATIEAVPSLQLLGTCNHNAKSLDEGLYERADVIAVNGEGTIHHSGHRALHLLNIIRRAKADRKSVILVNSLFQQYEYEDVKVLDGLALLTVREPRSAAFARRFGGNPLVLLDSAADGRFLEQGTPILGKEGLLVGGFHEKGLLYDPFSEVDGQRLTMRSGSFEDIVATLRGADIYLTAQHHGVYAAALAGCPFVASPSNSHKIEAFISWTGFPVPVCMSLNEVRSAMQFSRRNRSMFSEISEFMREIPVLSSELISEALCFG